MKDPAPTDVCLCGKPIYDSVTWPGTWLHVETKRDLCTSDVLGPKATPKAELSFTKTSIPLYVWSKVIWELRGPVFMWYVARRVYLFIGLVWFGFMGLIWPDFVLEKLKEPILPVIESGEQDGTPDKETDRIAEEA